MNSVSSVCFKTPCCGEDVKQLSLPWKQVENGPSGNKLRKRNLTALALLIVDSITITSSTSGKRDSKLSSYLYLPPDLRSRTRLTRVFIGLKGRNFMRNTITSVDLLIFKRSGCKSRQLSIRCLLSSGQIKLQVNSVDSPSLMPSKLLHLTTSSSNLRDCVLNLISVFSLLVSVIPTIG